MKREPTAYLVADTLLIVGDEVLLVQRKHEPFQGKWGLPGGFVDPDEKVLDAANRELEEETGISNLNLKQFATYGDPGRDPRGRVASVVHWVRLSEKPQARAGDDAADARWYHINYLPPLAFDHARILEDARSRLAELK
jgi:8-oxo-dGTP diphosphatase